MTTTQTVLLVGGTALGAFVLLKLLAPPTPVVSKPKASTDVVSLNGLIGLGTAVAGFLSNRGSGEPPISGGHYDFGAAEQANIDAYNAQPGQQYGIAGVDYSF